jgi:hypothetical protein
VKTKKLSLIKIVSEGVIYTSTGQSDALTVDSIHFWLSHRLSLLALVRLHTVASCIRLLLGVLYCLLPQHYTRLLTTWDWPLLLRVWHLVAEGTRWTTGFLLH